MSDVIRLSGVTVNAPDAMQLAEFYARITGGAVRGDAGWATVSGPNGSIGFQQIQNFRPTTWPDGEAPMQLHLEFFVDDLAATEARVLAAGATRFASQPNSDHCYVYADPAGHPFCLSLWDSPEGPPALSGTSRSREHGAAATLEDVARLAGVSRGTASRAINESDHVSAHARAAVTRAVRLLHYTPDPHARELAVRGGSTPPDVP